MPELPETETIARDLDAALRGARVAAVAVLRADVLRGEKARPRQALDTSLRDAALLRVWRRAKAIVLDFERGLRLVVTPRFTGALRISGDPVSNHAATEPNPQAFPNATEAEPLPFTCIRLRLHDGRELTYVDVRRLGTVELMPPDRFAAWNSALGPEPLDPALSPEAFSGILRGSTRAVKTVLMDQRRLAGVGNIYANEACFRAGIRPRRSARRVTRAEAERLLAELRGVLSESISLRGTTFRDFQDAYGARGGFAARLQVYGRGGEACLHCGSTLRETHALEGRSTVWCPSCQR